MTCLLLAVLWMGAGAGGPAPPARGQVVDAVRAVVNRQAITASAVRQAAWYSRLVADLHRGGGLPAAAPAAVTAAEREQAMAHLISAALLAQARRQAGVRGDPPPAAVAQQLQRMQTLAGGAAAWPGVLARYHLSPAIVRAILARQLGLLLFADARCRRQARVTRGEVAAYYQHSFLPAARRARIRPAALPAVAPRIRAILLQRQLERLELQWIHRLRAAAQVQIFPVR